VRTVGVGCISSAQPTPVDEHDATQHPPVIHARLAVVFGKKRFQLPHLLISQPKQVAHSGLLTELESGRNAHINGS